MKFGSLLILGVLSCSSLLPAQIQSVSERKTFDPADIADLKLVSDPRISPDGKQVAYVVASRGESGKPMVDRIWVVPTDGSSHASLLLLSDGSDQSPRWSPDGESIAFLSDRKNPLAGGKDKAFQFSLAGVQGREDVVRKGEPSSTADPTEEKKEMQLWLLPTRGGEALPLTDLPGGIQNIQWSRDGRFIAFIRKDQDTPKVRANKDRKTDEVVADHDYKFDRLWIYDVARHEARLVTQADINIDDYDWSPNGAQFIARVSPTPRIDDYWRVSKIMLIDAATGSIQRTIEEHAGYTTPRWSLDGRHIFFSRMTPKRITDVHAVFDLASGKEISVERATAGTVGQLAWTPDGKSVLAEVIEGAHTGVVKLDVSSGTGSPLTGMKGIASFGGSINFDHSGVAFAFVGQTFTQAEEAWVFRDGKAHVLADTNPQVASWKLGSEREIEWKSSKDGRTIYGVLVLPPDYQPGKRYKTVVHIHGGPEEAWTTGWHGSWYNYAAMLSSHGYVVLLPNPRGSDGQGPEFTEANFQDWGGGDFQDIEDGVDSLIAKGIADPERLVIGGWSYGGFMTAWTVTHTDRFKAAMVGAGVTDTYSMATTTDIAPSFQDGYFGSLATNRQIYDKHSPVRYLDQCHTPVLVLHGESDPRVPISQGQEFYYGLRFMGREAMFVHYPREPHIFTEREHQCDSLQRMLDWYDSHLAM